MGLNLKNVVACYYKKAQKCSSTMSGGIRLLVIFELVVTHFNDLIIFFK